MSWRRAVVRAPPRKACQWALKARAVELVPTLGLLGLLLVKEAGVPIPIPGDLLVLGAGIAAAGAGPAGLVVLAGILLAGFVGGSLQFVLVKGALRRPIVRMLGRAGVPESRLEQLAGWLRRRGTSGVAVARATPGLRIGAIAASGLAALPFTSFLAGLVAGNSVFVGAHFALGYIVGRPALAVLTGSGGLLFAGGAVVALAAVGAIGWAALRSRRAGLASRGGREGLAEGAAEEPAEGPAAAPVPADLASLGSWAEAACPACLAISLARRDRSSRRRPAGSDRSE